MARSTKDDYSHQQDVEQLNQTLISLKERYADNRRANIISECEAEFWAYRLILAPIYANTQLENELHRLPSDLRNNPRVQTALEIFRLLKSIIIHRNYDNYVQCQSNWKRFWELIKSPRVSYLMACAAAISFNRVRHVALDVVWRCYRVGLYRHQVPVEFWTTDRLREVLGMDTEAEAVEFCEAHGFVFEVNEAGQTFMDIKQKSYDRKANVLPKADIKPQFFSATIVEAKRCGRPLSAVIAGLTVQEAKKGGLSAAQAQHMEDQTSLFVPETTSVFKRQPIETTPAGGFGFNATASPFQPNGTSTTTPNPFAKAIQPGLFDPSKNKIQFAQPSDANANPFLRKDTNSSQSASSAASPNPFLKNNATPSESTTPQTAANPFLKFNNAAQSEPTSTPAPANPFLKNNTVQPQSTIPPTPANPFTSGSFAPSQPQPQTNTPFAAFQAPEVTTTPKPAPAFNFAGSSFDTTPAQETSQAGQSFTPSGTPPPADSSSQEAEAEQAKKEAAERQRKEAEARQRVQEAQRAKQAKEAERKREAEAAEAAAARQRQEQADRERKAREQQEELARQARLRQAQEEEARQARIREKDSALHALTADVMFNPQEGLMMQFIENALMSITKEAANTVEMEKRIAMVDRKYKKYQDELKRAGLAKMMAAVQKKKRLQKARERRKRLKEQRAKVEAGQEEEPTDAPAPVQPAIPNGKTTTAVPPEELSVPQQPSNSRRAKRTQQRHQAQTSETNGVSSTKSASVNEPTPEAIFDRSTSNASTSITAYSQAYQQAVANAPVDRTETDWFRLRAMGIDPSKHRKRSFDFGSSDEEKPKLIESKRPKLSPVSPAPEPQEQLVPKTMVEEQRARAEAIKESFRRSTSTTSPSHSFNGAMSFSGRSSFNDSTSNVIARARQTLADSRTAMPPPSFTPGRSTYRSGSFDGNASQLIARAKGLASPAGSSSNTQHDWSRSVPNLGFSASQTQQSAYGTSTNGSNLRTSTWTKDRPAYWQRTSRFVPRHLYGKGADAVRAYRIEQGLSKSPASTRPASTEPLDISSPIPTQLSYDQQAHSYPLTYSQEQFTTDLASLNGIQVNTFDTQGESAIMTDNEDDVRSYNHFDITDSYPPAQFTSSQAHHQHHQPQKQEEEQEEYYDQDADSEMLDGEDEELLDYDEDSDLDEEEEEIEEDDQESFDEDEDEEDDSEDDGGSGAPDSSANGKPGATEDDAIELSD
jgi:hypothetical protein